MRILIIDDDVDLRNLLERYIKQQWPDSQVDQYDPLDHDIPPASFPLGNYDVMILDYMLGRGDGLQWLQEFKRRADCPPALYERLINGFPPHAFLVGLSSEIGRAHV